MRAAPGLGPRVQSISDGRLTALVSEGPPSRRREDGDASIHELVTEAAARDHTVIPFAPGSVLGSEEEVMDLLRGTRAALGEVLDAIRGKVELRLVVRWDRERVVAEIEQESGEVRAMRACILTAEHGVTYWDRLRLARLVEAALEERLRRYAAEVHVALRECCVAIRATPAEGDDVVLASALLVERSCVAQLVRVTERLAGRYAGRLFFERSPLRSPSSFVNMKLRLESAG